MSCAAVAAGADGLLIEVHDNPDSALSDGEQSITPDMLADLFEKVSRVSEAVGKDVQ
jgi:3-deoxy-7-phosphoheptulonate synthase